MDDNQGKPNEGDNGTTMVVELDVACSSTKGDNGTTMVVKLDVACSSTKLDVSDIKENTDKKGKMKQTGEDNEFPNVLNFCALSKGKRSPSLRKRTPSWKLIEDAQLRRHNRGSQAQSVANSSHRRPIVNGSKCRPIARMDPEDSFDRISHDPRDTENYFCVHEHGKPCGKHWSRHSKIPVVL